MPLRPPETLYARYLDPPWSEPARRERLFLDAGSPLSLATEYGPVAGRLWPAEEGREGRGRVLLAHGWAGRSATWLVLVPLLNAAGLDAFAYDVPGHGDTRPPGTPGRSHFFAFAATLRAAGEAHGPFVGVVGHSFGASVLPFALGEGLPAARAVLVAPTAVTSDDLSRWSSLEGLSEQEEAAVGALWAAEFGADRLADLDAAKQARAMTIPALVLHDEGDAETPVQDGEAVAGAWPGARFERTRGLGHRRILLSRDAMARVADFVTPVAENRTAP